VLGDITSLHFSIGSLREGIFLFGGCEELSGGLSVMVRGLGCGMGIHTNSRCELRLGGETPDEKV
jgi:hypothetical protein